MRTTTAITTSKAITATVTTTTIITTITERLTHSSVSASRLTDHSITLCALLPRLSDRRLPGSECRHFSTMPVSSPLRCGNLHSHDLLQIEPAASISLASGQTFLAMKPHAAASSQRIERAAQATHCCSRHKLNSILKFDKMPPPAHGCDLVGDVSSWHEMDQPARSDDVRPSG